MGVRLQLVMEASTVSVKASSLLRADREERDTALRELLEENDGLQMRLQESLDAAARQQAACAAQEKEQRETVARLCAEAAAANSIIGELRSQAQELHSLDIQRQSELKMTRAELDKATGKLQEATQSSSFLPHAFCNRLTSIEAHMQLATQE